jgi:hypothetical protein
VEFCRILLTFQKNVLPPFSGSKIKFSKQATSICLLGLLFDPEVRGRRHPRNTSKPLPKYNASHPWKCYTFVTLTPVSCVIKWALCVSKMRSKLSSQRIYWRVRFEVFTAVTIKNAVFWDVALCTSCVNRCFGGNYRLHLQGRKMRERGTGVSRRQQSAAHCSR